MIVSGAGAGSFSSTASGSRAGGLLVGLGVAVVTRALVEGGQGASSLLGAIVFSFMLGAVSLRSGWRPGRLRRASVLPGVAGGLVLVAGPLIRGTLINGSAAGSGHMAIWTIVVSMVALAEEVLFRGALWALIERQFGRSPALIATTVLFAAIHVPLYGWQAAPLDLAVGLELGALRLWTGGIAAPATAHVVADVAGGWL